MRRGLALLVAAALLLSGCWDRTEVEDTAYAIVIGVDATEQGECLWSFLIAKLPAAQGGGAVTTTSPDQPGAGPISVTGCTMERALQHAQASLGRVLSLVQVRYVVVGEEIARSKMRSVVSQLMRHNQIRRGAGLIVGLPRAVDLLMAFDPLIDVNVIKVQEGLLLAQKRFHLAPPIRLQHYLSRLMSEGEDAIVSVGAVNPLARERPGGPMPRVGSRRFIAGQIPRRGGNPVEVAGTAVFRGDRMAGILDVEETAALLALRGEMGKVYLDLPDPTNKEKQVAIRFGQENKPQFRASLAEGKPVLHVRLQLEGELLAAPAGTDYSRPENRRMLEDFISRYFEQEVYPPLLHKIYKEWRADPAAFGHVFRAQFPTIDAWIAYDWARRIKELEVTVELAMFIRRFGLVLEEMPPQEGDK